MPYRFGGVQPLGTHIDAVLDAVATKYAKGVVQFCQALVRCGISTVGEEAISLKEPRWPDEPIRIPPKRGAAGRATSAQNTLIEAIKLCPLLGLL